MEYPIGIGITPPTALPIYSLINENIFSDKFNKALSTFLNLIEIYYFEHEDIITLNFIKNDFDNEYSKCYV